MGLVRVWKLLEKTINDPDRNVRGGAGRCSREARLQRPGDRQARRCRGVWLLPGHPFFCRNSNASSL